MVRPASPVTCEHFRSYLETCTICDGDGPSLGYHLAEIPKGLLGEVSKIEEELAELKDAVAQGAKVLELCELADLVGAIECYLGKHHIGTTLQDILKMKDLNKRAFLSGRRS